MTQPEGATPEAPPDTATVTGDQEPATPPADEKAADQSDLGDAGKRALEAERATNRAQKKELARLKKLVDDAEAAKLSDLEKANKAAESEKARADELAAQVTRLKVIREAGLPAELEEFLPDSADEAVLSEKAKKLMDRFAAKPGTPRPDPSQGAKGAAGAVSLDARIAEAQKAGNFKEVIRLQNDRLMQLVDKQR